MLIKQEKKQGFVEKALLTWLPVASLFILGFSYFPQLYLTFSTQNVEGQSVTFWILLSLALLITVGQQIGMIKYRGAKSYVGLISQSLNLILAVAMLVGVIIFS